MKNRDRAADDRDRAANERDLRAAMRDMQDGDDSHDAMRHEAALDRMAAFQDRLAASQDRDAQARKSEGEEVGHSPRQHRPEVRRRARR